ncbi:MAG: FtsK/SpoIIIE domain-containing protein [Microbacteriaceae bacterium]
MNESLVMIPAPPVRAGRARFPWLAAVVPFVGGVVLWGVTGSPSSLLFGLLGPIIALASVLDAARGGRRAYREACAAHARQLERARARVAEHHERERAHLAARHPDALQLLALPARIWRALPGDEARISLARGSRPSECRVRVSGGGDDGGDGYDGAHEGYEPERRGAGRGRGRGRARPRGRRGRELRAGALVGADPAALARLRAEAAAVHDAPITIPATDGTMLLGDAPFVRAAARALVLQLCMTHAPDALRLVRLPPEGWEWARELPHAEPAAVGVCPPAPPGTAGGAQLAPAWRSGPAPGRDAMRDGGAAPLRLVVVDAGESARLPGVTGACGGFGGDGGRSGGGSGIGVEIRIVAGPVGAPVDPGCAALVEVHGADGAATLSLTGPGADRIAAREADQVAVGLGVGLGVGAEQHGAAAVQLLGEAQARAITELLRERALALFPPVVPSPLPELDELLEEASGAAGVEGGPPGCPLPVPFAVAEGVALPIDIVAAGPHALIAGTTGSGKSELMVSWITALCALYPPERVVFLLADFKGGTAFASLAELPHVVGVITDLDAGGASRALESLQAELRWREARLADAGARDIADGRVEMPRLLVVIDEFAALLAQHPQLQEMFADLAARGRALGVHLVLGTQRAAETVRDGLLANIPLRFCLRVVDEGESRAVLGVAGAAALAAAHPGVMLVRRAADSAPFVARVVRASASDRGRALGRWAGHPPPRRPWQPPLPTRLEVDALAAAVAVHAGRFSAAAAAHADGGDGDVMPAAGTLELPLGLLDEPAAQRQRPWAFVPARDRSLLVVGGAGSGKSAALRMVEHAVGGRPDGLAVVCIRIGADREHAWDTIERLAQLREDGAMSTLVLIDDLDALIAGMPGDYAAVLIDRLERLLREGFRAGITLVAGAQRMPIGGTRIGESFHTRLLLRLPSRADHLAAGGDARSFEPNRPAGRGTIDGLEVQLALPPALGAVRPSGAPGPRGRAEAPTAPCAEGAAWRPPAGPIGVVSRAPAATEERLRAAWSPLGAIVLSLRALPSGTRLGELVGLGEHAVAVVGDAQAWQEHWSLLAAIRAAHPLIIEGPSWVEFRALTGSRELPPYIAGDSGWLCAPDGTVSRVRLPRGRGRGSGATSAVS